MRKKKNTFLSKEYPTPNVSKIKGIITLISFPRLSSKHHTNISRINNLDLIHSMYSYSSYFFCLVDRASERPPCYQDHSTRILGYIDLILLVFLMEIVVSIELWKLNWKKLGHVKMT